jgi:hypothetical protein
MDRFKIELMRALEREYYREKKRDEWGDLKYLSIRIGLVGLLALIVFSIWKP